METNAPWYDVVDFYKHLGFVEYARTASRVDLELLLTAPEPSV